MAEYTMKELCEIIDRKPSMVYNYIKEDKQFYEQHRKKDNKKGFLYDEEVLTRLKEKIGVSNGVGWGNSKNEDGNNPQYTAPSSQPQEEEANIKLKKELEKLKAECAELQARCEKLEAENKDLREQNGNILWLLTQEKLEKQKLLPQPRKSIVGRIKELFSRPSANGNNNSPSA